jgi:signal transduction histidine kinase
LTILLATALIVHYSLRPLYTLLCWLDNYKPGKGVKDLPKENSSIEFQKLTQAAHDTIERAEIQLDIEKQFIGNASHELQTPLAVLSTRIEWLMDKTSLTEEQFAELTKMRQSLHRLIRLNRTLLLLSKIDNGQFPDKSDIDIVGLVKSEIETYNEIFADKELTVHMELPSKSSISMNESLAATLVTNLIKNAFLHTSAGGDITIKYYSRQLTVSNSGDTAIDGQKIFNRFYTSGKTGSTGLGLALVKSIAGYYDFGLDYSFSNGRHSFTVKF